MGSHGGYSVVALLFEQAMKTLRVLIVEDYRDTAELLALRVRSAGHDAEVCYTGFQAEQIMPNYRPDVVLLDVGLPDMDGWELAPSLRRDNPLLKRPTRVSLPPGSSVGPARPPGSRFAPAAMRYNNLVLLSLGSVPGDEGAGSAMTLPGVLPLGDHTLQRGRR